MKETLMWNTSLEMLLNNASTHFYQNTDNAHTLMHIKEVKERAFDMANWYYDYTDTKVDMDVILIAATLHDMGGAIDREKHPEESVKLLLTDPNFNNLPVTKEQINKACEAILQHGSHVSEPYKSKECEVMASADRDEPDIYNILRRSMQYTIAHCESKEEAIDSCTKYNCSRYGVVPSKDYRVPDWHFLYWNKKKHGSMELLHKAFKDKERIKLICHILYEALTNKLGVNKADIYWIAENGVDEIFTDQYLCDNKNSDIASTIAEPKSLQDIIGNFFSPILSKLNR